MWSGSYNFLSPKSLSIGFSSESAVPNIFGASASHLQILPLPSRLSALVPASLRRALPPRCAAAAPVCSALRIHQRCISYGGSSRRQPPLLGTQSFPFLRPHCSSVYQNPRYVASVCPVLGASPSAGVPCIGAFASALYVCVSRWSSKSGGPAGPSHCCLRFSLGDRCFGGVLYLCFAIVDGPASTTPPFLGPYYLPLAQQSALFLSTGEFPPNVPVAPFLL